MMWTLFNEMNPLLLKTPFLCMLCKLTGIDMLSFRPWLVSYLASVCYHHVIFIFTDQKSK